MKILNAREQAIANRLTKQANALGFEADITTLTQIISRVSEQKFYQVAPADYVPIRVGQGPWETHSLTYRSFDVADAFETGLFRTGGDNSKHAIVGSAIDTVMAARENWKKEINWTIVEVEQASRSGNWSLIEMKEKARKRNWDLGIQKTAFLGLNGLNGSTGNSFGLLNQPQASVNTTRITKAISSMSESELKTLTANIIGEYQTNANLTVYPDFFVVPTSDYNGLASPSSATFPLKSTLQLLREAFAEVTMNPGFKILPCGYADAAFNSEIPVIGGKQCYALGRYDEETMVMDVSVPYSTGLVSTFDGFSFRSIGFGQFTGVTLLRPLELLYFRY